MSILQVPKLTGESEKYCGSSTFLSEQVINSLTGLLPRVPDFTLSIGSGIGLIEALLARDHEYWLECVEVPSLQHEPKYVGEDVMHYVKGTWDTCARAVDAAMWLFMFPRDPRLLATYVSRYSHGGVSTIIWVGPAGDARDYASAMPVELCGPASYLHDLSLQPSEAALIWRLPRTVTMPMNDAVPCRNTTKSLVEDEIEGL